MLKVKSVSESATKGDVMKFYGLKLMGVDPKEKVDDDFMEMVQTVVMMKEGSRW